MSYIFDSHVHIFPQKIALKAAKNIGAFYDLDMDCDGSVEGILALCEKNKVNKCLVHSVATVPEQVKSINNFIAASVEEHKDKFIGFCSLHPDLSEKELANEVDRNIEQGLRGIKLHPDFQKFYIDSKEAYKIYEIAEGRLPILFHVGDYRYGYSAPKRLADALKDFPKLKVIAAHFGGWSEWDKGEKYLAGKENVYVDTSSSFYTITPDKAKEYINAFGEDRVLFGSDYPMWDVKNELEYLEKLKLDETVKEKILYRNACELLDIEM